MPNFLSRLSRRAVLPAAALSLLLAAPAPARDRLPIETFFNYDSIGQVTISPDGNKIAMLAPNGGRYSLALLDTTDGKLSVVVRFADENIESFFWKGNSTLLFTSTIEGHEIPLLASTDLEGKNVRRILEPRRHKHDFSLFSGGLEDRFPASDDHILIAGFTDEPDARRINPSVPVSVTATIYKTNVHTGRRLGLVTLHDDEGGVLFDAAGNMRVGELEENGQLIYRVRDANDKPWREIKRFPMIENRWEFQALMADNRTAYLIDQTENDRGVLRAMDLTTGELGSVVFSPEQGEIEGLILAPKRKRLLGIAYEDDKSHVLWVDPHWKAIVATLEAQIPDHGVAITSIAEDEKRFIFLAYSDRDPGQYFLGDLRGDGLRVQLITPVRPAIKPERMSPMVPITFKARDGLVMHGYLTKPGGVVDAHTPLLVLPHGGPFTIRDSWGFDPEVQFLANRGYAVLQVNYRGSGGYGLGFMEAGKQEWGGKMQDDLTDAVKWVIAQGWADPARVGIIGASYGGYAALAGVTMTPDLYKVGINYVGVSDLRLITRWDLGHSASGKAWQEKWIGKDPEFLKSRSPVELVANIRVPTLHAYGKNDPRVEYNQWEVLEAALKKHGKNYEAVVEEKEGHGFRKEEARLKFFSAVDAFLAKYMPAK